MFLKLIIEELRPSRAQSLKLFLRGERSSKRKDGFLTQTSMDEFVSTAEPLLINVDKSGNIDLGTEALKINPPVEALGLPLPLPQHSVLTVEVTKSSGDTAIISCNIPRELNAENLLRISWTRVDGRPMPHGYRLNGANLLLPRLQRNFAGEYKCVLEDISGREFVAMVNLNVTDYIPQFDGHSVISMSPISEELWERLDLEMDVMPKTKNGIIFHAVKHVAEEVNPFHHTISLNDGKVRYSFNVGGGEKTLETSYSLPSGQWFHLRVENSPVDAQLRVNNWQALIIPNEVFLTQQDDENEARGTVTYNTYLGGIELADRKLLTTTIQQPFEGSIGQIFVSKKSIDLGIITAQSDMSLSLSANDCYSHPCESGCECDDYAAILPTETPALKQVLQLKPTAAPLSNLSKQSHLALPTGDYIYKQVVKSETSMTTSMPSVTDNQRNEEKDLLSTSIYYPLSTLSSSQKYYFSQAHSVKPYSGEILETSSSIVDNIDIPYTIPSTTASRVYDIMTESLPIDFTKKSTTESVHTEYENNEFIEFTTLITPDMNILGPNPNFNSRPILTTEPYDATIQFHGSAHIHATPTNNLLVTNTPASIFSDEVLALEASREELDVFEKKFQHFEPFAGLCDEAKCGEHGVCETVNLSHVMCSCRDYFVGVTCDEFQPIEYASRFDGSAFIAFSADEFLHLTGEKEESIALRFRTTSKNGIIFWQGQRPEATLQGEDYVSIGLKDGFLVFSFELGGGAAILKSTMRLNDGREHFIEAFRKGRNGTLFVDMHAPVYGTSSGILAMLNVEGNIYLGGLPDLERMTAEIYKSNFVGCIAEITLNKSKIDIMASAIDGRNVRSCDEWQFRSRRKHTRNGQQN